MGHLACNYWSPGVGAKNQENEEDGENFPNVDDEAYRNPPCPGEPRERTLANGAEVKWCGECDKWGYNYRTRLPDDANDGVDGDNVAVEEDVDGDEPPEEEPDVSGAIFDLQG